MKTRVLAGLILATTVAAASAQASTVGVSTLGALGANDYAAWDQFAVFSTVANPGAMATNTGRTVTVTNSGAQPFIGFRFDAAGYMPGDTALLDTGSGGPILTFTFDHAVFGAGAYIQPDYAGLFGARVTASDGSIFNVAGNSSSGHGSVFLGLLSDTASITSISFQLTSAIRNPEDFFMGRLDINEAPLQVIPDGPRGGVPEPATWAMMILGLGGMGATLRRRRYAGVAA